MSAQAAGDFDALYAASDDPWHIDLRWYERRKRALLLATLPCERVGTILEPGCGTGALSIALAARCDRLYASDISEKAIALARRRLHGLAHVEFACQRIPEQWPQLPPALRADCVIVSELGYYLSLAALDELALRIGAVLAVGGTLIACHWKGGFAERTMETAAIHARLQDRLGLPVLALHDEADFLLHAWSADTRSVATREGFA